LSSADTVRQARHTSRPTRDGRDSTGHGLRMRRWPRRFARRLTACYAPPPVTHDARRLTWRRS
jgi:hypothetical protein